MSPPLRLVQPAFLQSDGISLEVPVRAPQLRLISFIVLKADKGKESAASGASQCVGGRGWEGCVLDGESTSGEWGTVETRQMHTDKYLTVEQC